MPDLSYADRCLVIDQLDEVAQGLVRGAMALDERGYHAAAAMLDRASREIAACCWCLWSPVREGAQGPPQWPAEAEPSAPNGQPGGG